MEACAGIGLIAAAGEYNGFLKPSVRLFRNALRFEQGKLHLPADYHPDIDRDVLKAHELACERFEAGWFAQIPKRLGFAAAVMRAVSESLSGPRLYRDGSGAYFGGTAS